MREQEVNPYFGLNLLASCTVLVQVPDLASRTLLVIQITPLHTIMLYWYSGNVSRLIKTGASAHLISPHPFVLEEMGRWLGPPKIPFERIRLPFTLAPHIERLATRRGSVCVVDGCLPFVVTESLVSGVLAGSPEARIIVVAEELTDSLVFPLLRMGVKGLLTYANARRELLPALAAVAKGGYWVPRDLLSRFLDTLAVRGPVHPAPQPGALSRREQDVLAAVLQNLSNKEIAARLNISERTAKFHVSNLLAKFSVQRRADLILHSFQSRG